METHSVNHNGNAPTDTDDIRCTDFKKSTSNQKHLKSSRCVDSDNICLDQFRQDLCDLSKKQNQNGFVSMHEFSSPDQSNTDFTVTKVLESDGESASNHIDSDYSSETSLKKDTCKNCDNNLSEGENRNYVVSQQCLDKSADSIHESLECLTLNCKHTLDSSRSDSYTENSHKNSRDQEILPCKLEDATSNQSVSSSLENQCDTADKQPINYVVYSSEKQMQNIIQLITRDLSEPYSIYTYRYFIHNWPQLCFLAMDSNNCVGAIVCKAGSHKNLIRRGYIAMLAIDQNYRRRGIGSHLVMKAIRAMVKDECDEVVLETEITNRAALQLYENLGFVRDKRLFRYYLNGVDALRLKLWLK